VPPSARRTESYKFIAILQARPVPLEATATSVTGETTSPSGPAAHTILIVEDEPVIRRGMQRVLENAGFVVLTASTPIEAIERAADQELPIQLLVTDFGLHAVTGRQVAEVLRQVRPRLRVLYVSGHPENLVLPDGGPPGTAFLQKPFTPAALVQHVRTLLEQIGGTEAV